MKRLFNQFMLASLVAVLLAACGQTSSPASNESSAEASQLLARAMADIEAREYIAQHLERDAADPFAEMTTEQLHSPAFYQVLTQALSAQGETLKSVEAAFNALPNAYLIAPVNSEAWDARSEAPLIAFVSEEDDVVDTLYAYDSALSSYTLAVDEVPDQMLLVLYEGFAAEPATLETLQNVACTTASDNGKFTTRAPFVMVDAKGKGQRGVAQRAATPGWVITDATISVDRKGNSGASMNLLNAGNQFILLSELKKVRDVKLDIAGKLDKKQLEVKAAVNSTYEQFIKYTTEKVFEQTLAVEWYVDSRILLFGSKVKVVATITEMCNNVDAVSTAKTSAAFDSAMARAAGGTIPTTTGKLSFSINPPNVTAYLSVKGNGKTYSASRATVLELAPGTYTVSGYGYEGLREYTMSTQTVSVTAGANKTLPISMRLTSSECGNPNEPSPIFCP